MKFVYFLSAALAFSVFSTHAFARIGGISDGGGNAVVCRDQNKNILSATLLDLYEAEKIYKLKPQPNELNKTYFELAKEAAQRIDKGGAGNSVTGVVTRSADGKLIQKSFIISPTIGATSTTQNGVEYVNKSINLIGDVGLSPIDDSNSLIRPKNCEIEQTAIYLDSGDEIHVVEEIWNAFDNINKAGLLVHEALYRNMRMAGETNSDRTRKVVGHAFAGSSFKNILDGVPNTTTICGTNEGASQNRFAIFEETPGVATLQFFILDGKVPMSKTVFKMPIHQSPIGKLEPGIDGTTYIGNFAEALLEKKLIFAVNITLDSAKQVKSSVGLVNKVVDEKNFLSLTCNSTNFYCDKNSCKSTDNVF